MCSSSRTSRQRIVVWEAFDVADPMTQAAGDLYEKTLPVDERIPWIWIEKSVESRTKTKPGKADGWTKHLLLAAPENRVDDPAALAGYVYGALIPNLRRLPLLHRRRRLGPPHGRRHAPVRSVLPADGGGCGRTRRAVAVRDLGEPPARSPTRRRATGTCGRRGRSSSIASAGTGWRASTSCRRTSRSEEETMRRRCRCSCSSSRSRDPAGAFDGDRLKQIVAGLHREVYQNEPGDPLHDRTLPPDCPAAPAPAKLAGLPIK